MDSNNPADFDPAFDFVDDEEFSRLVEEAVGDELDHSMLEEFRNSEFYEEFVASLATFPTPAVRPPSPQSNNASQNDVIPDQPMAVSSSTPKTSGTSKTKAKRGNRSGASRRRENHWDSSSSSSSTSSSPPRDNVFRNRLKLKPQSSSTSRERDKKRLGNVPPSSNFPESSRNLLQQQHETKGCSLTLYDIKQMTSIFPNGIRQPVKVTARMLAEIKSIEQRVRAGLGKKADSIRSVAMTHTPTQKKNEIGRAKSPENKTLGRPRKVPQEKTEVTRPLTPPLSPQENFRNRDSQKKGRKAHPNLEKGRRQSPPSRRKSKEASQPRVEVVKKRKNRVSSSSSENLPSTTSDADKLSRPDVEKAKMQKEELTKVKVSATNPKSHLEKQGKDPISQVENPCDDSSVERKDNSGDSEDCLVIDCKEPVLDPPLTNTEKADKIVEEEIMVKVDKKSAEAKNSESEKQVESPLLPEKKADQQDKKTDMREESAPSPDGKEDTPETTTASLLEDEISPSSKNKSEKPETVSSLTLDDKSSEFEASLVLQKEVENQTVKARPLPSMEDDTGISREKAASDIIADSPCAPYMEVSMDHTIADAVVASVAIPSETQLDPKIVSALKPELETTEGIVEDDVFLHHESRPREIDDSSPLVPTEQVPSPKETVPARLDDPTAEESQDTPASGEKTPELKPQEPSTTTLDDVKHEVYVSSPPPSVDNNDDDGLPPAESPPSPSDQVNPTKSPSPERVVTKKKNVIESSSDDGDVRKDTTEDTDTTVELGKSGDDEPARKSFQFERKKEEVDSRARKFDRFEDERRRKMEDKKKEKSKDNDPLEDVFKDKALAGSFRIPKKGTHISRRQKKESFPTPLASAEIPKEKIVFEKSRKVPEKKEFRDFNSSNYDTRLDFKKDGPPNYKQRNRYLDDGRSFLPPHDLDKRPERTIHTAKVEINNPEPDPEPLWGDDGDDRSGAGSSCEDKALTLAKVKEEVEAKKVVGETVNLAEQATKDKSDPEVPVETVEINQLAHTMNYLLTEMPETIQLPNVDSVNNLYEATAMKLAWWFFRADFEKAVDVNDSDDDEDGAPRDVNLSYLDSLESESEDDDDDLPKRQGTANAVDEYTGRTLLTSQYRVGPGDKFAHIFTTRTGASYDEKENFQAQCNLCNVLVVGRSRLASHILSEEHRDKMETTGVDPSEDKKRPTAKKETVKIERDKKPESANDKENSITEEKEDQKSDEKGGRVHRKDRSEKDQKRRRSSERQKDRVDEKSRRNDDGDIVGTTSTGLSLKIPSSAIPEKNLTGKGHRSKSRSKSPHRKRPRSRSPRRRRSKSRSRSPRSRRRRSPIHRIARSPERMRNEREMRRRSTSAERVQKFLEKNSRQQLRNRSRSPRHSRNKRHRRSRSKSPEQGLSKRNNREFQEKLMLTAQGKWNQELESKWTLMEVDLAIYMEQFGERRKSLITVPEKHPDYGSEWTGFWERRFHEVDQEGKDPDSFDYVPEWKEYWSKKLRELLEIECEKESLEIKRRHGMDLETLQRIRNTEPEPLIPAPVPPPVISPGQVPNALFNPGPVPAPVPPPVPQHMVSTSASSSTPTQGALAFPSPGPVSIGSGHGGDFMARSMSISDDGSGRGQPANMNGAPSKVASQPITTGDIISQWEKLKSGSGPVRSPAPGMTMLDPKPKSGRSDVSESQSIESVEFNGLALVQVLRVMSIDLEFELSFFSPQVKEYFQRAEALDLKKRNKSLELLDEEDFVVMLFSIRDRFLAMIRANVHTGEVLHKLNVTLFSLTSLLEDPKCQKHRSKIASAASALKELEKQDVSSLSSNGSDRGGGVTAGPSKPPPPPAEPAVPGSKTLSEAQKEQIAKAIVGFLLTMGRNHISDDELRKLVGKIVPSVNVGPAPTQKSPSTTTALSSGASTNSQRPGHGTVSKMYSIASSHVVGSAVPQLSGTNVPMFHRNVREERDEWDRDRTRSSSASESNSGRHSPFSRRNYSGNPVMNSHRDKDDPLTPHDAEIGITHTGLELAQVKKSVRKARNSLNLLTTRRKAKANGSGSDTTLGEYHSQASSPTPESTSTKPKLPPGIMQFVMMERCARDRPDSTKKSFNLDIEKFPSRDNSRPIKSPERRPEIVNLSDAENLREQKSGKKKRKRRARASSTTSSSSSSSFSSEKERRYHKERRKSRRRRKKKRKKKSQRRKLAARSDSSEYSNYKNHFVRRAPPEPTWDEKTKENFVSERVQERAEPSQSKGRRFIPATFIPSPTHSVASSRKSVKVRIVVPSHPDLVYSDWEEEASGKKEPEVKKAPTHEPERRPFGVCTQSGAKILSVSETFWKRGDNDSKSLCSISSAEVENVANCDKVSTCGPRALQLMEKMPKSVRRKELNEEREPGEITSSD